MGLIGFIGFRVYIVVALASEQHLDLRSAQGFGLQAMT